MPFSVLLQLVAIIFGVIATTYGLHQISWFDSARVDYAIIFVVLVIAIEAFTRLFKVTMLSVCVIIVSLFSVLAGAIWPLIVTLLFGLSSFLLGHSILSLLKNDENCISISNSFLVGAGVYGTTVGLLAHFPVNYPALYGFAMLLPVFFWRNKISQLAHQFKITIKQSDELKWLDISIILVSLIHFSVSLMPELGHDALAMHLFIPGHMLHRHEWGFDVTTYVWAAMPMMGDWIYSLVYVLGGETAARMTNVGFVIFLGWLIRELVFWAGGNAQGAKWAVLIYLSTPLVYAESSSLFIESIWTSFIVGGSLAIFKLLSSGGGEKIQLPVAGFLLGVAAASKSVTFMVLPVLLLLLVTRYRCWIKSQLVSSIIIGLVLFTLSGAIPYITAWHITGNPVFPFFNEYFQAPQYPPVNFSAGGFFEKGVSWDTVYRITFDSARYLEGRAGSAGFQWLLLLMPAVVLFIICKHFKGGVLVFVGVLAVILTFHQTAYLRYVFPSFVFLSASIGVFLSVIISSKDIYLQRIVVTVGILVVLLNIIFFKSATYWGAVSIHPLLSEANRTQFLHNKLPIRNAVQLVNQLNVHASPVAVFSQPLTAGLVSDALYPNWYNFKFQALISGVTDAGSVAEVLNSKGVEYVILDNGWGEPEKRNLIKEVTDEVLALNSISLRALRKEYLFKTELLKDTGLSEDGVWNYSEGVTRSVDGILASAASSATQVVSVVPGRKYLLAVTSRCANNPSVGRMQVNWLDKKSEFINTSINVFDCTQELVSNSMEVVSPKDAVKAVIYAAGHTHVSLIFNKVSFKK